MKLRVWTSLATVLLALAPAAAQAHQGYLTTYSHHIEAGELSLMLLTDYTSPSRLKRAGDGHGDYLSQMLELKYNPTNRLALEYMWEGFQDLEHGEGRYTGYRYEARYRLFGREVPLNPMVYAEYENLHLATRYKMEVSGWVDPPYTETAEEPYSERILESRLVLSQDLGRWNLAVNWINESDLDGGETAFGYTLGAMLRLHGGAGGGHRHHAAEGSVAGDGHEEHPVGPRSLLEPASISFEFFGALGDGREFGFEPSRQEHYFQPSLVIHTGEHSMVSVGYGIGLTEASDDLFRINVGWKF